MSATEAVDETALRREAEAFYEGVAARAATAPPPPMDPVGLRAAYPALVAASLGGELYRSELARDITIEADGRPLGCRVIEAERPAGLYLHVHGGGGALGSPELDDARTEHLMREAGLTTVSVDYRLAPEHPFPAGLDDCERAARWLMTEGVERYGSERVFVGGESLGANLALGVGLQLVREPPPSGVLAGLNLLYGPYDLRMTPSQRRSSAVLAPPLLSWLYDQYADADLRAEADVSPLFADLVGLPPVMLSVGDADPLVDDTAFLAARLRLAGVPHELSLLPGADHGFDAAPLGVARLARERIVAFLRARLAAEA